MYVLSRCSICNLSKAAKMASATHAVARVVLKCSDVKIIRLSIINLLDYFLSCETPFTFAFELVFYIPIHFLIDIHFVVSFL